jgi:hypothetical protein
VITRKGTTELLKAVARHSGGSDPIDMLMTLGYLVDVTFSRIPVEDRRDVLVSWLSKLRESQETDMRVVD